MAPSFPPSLAAALGVLLYLALLRSKHHARLGWAVTPPLPALPPRATIEADEDAQCLLRNHPDLALKVGNDLAAAKAYYATKGFFEGMSGACPQTDADADMYLTAYEDLRGLFGKDNDRLNKAREHWRKYGWRQGRIGHAAYKVLLAADAAGRAQKDAHRPYAESVYEDPAVAIAKKNAEAAAKVVKQTSALNKVVHLKSVLTGNVCATDAQGLVTCHGGGGPEPFQLESVGTGAFVLRSNRTQNYCREDPNDMRVRCDEPNPATASEFKYVPTTFDSFKMIRLLPTGQTGRPCDHDAQSLVCTFPSEAAAAEVPGGFQHEVASATIQTDNVKAKMQHVIVEVIQPLISDYKPGERAWGKEEEETEAKGSTFLRSVGIAVAVSSFAAAGVMGGMYLSKRKRI